MEFDIKELKEWLGSKDMVILDDMKGPMARNCGIILQAKSLDIAEGVTPEDIATLISNESDYFAFYAKEHIRMVNTSSVTINNNTVMPTYNEIVRLRYASFSKEWLDQQKALP